MNRRTVYLQEILQASDFLQAQKNAMLALNMHSYATHGFQFFTPIPQASALNLSVSALQVIIPAMAMYQVANQDVNAWPAVGPPILSTDATNLLSQGYNLTSTTKTWASPGGSGTYYVLIQGQVVNSDTTLSHIPFYPLIQTTTTAGTTSSVLKVVSSQGFAATDVIVVQGFTAAAGAPVLVTSVPDAVTINISPSLTATPGVGITVRDLVPNNGLPLDGINNDGNALNIDRVNTINLSLKVGAASGSPVRPTPDVGNMALWYLGPYAVAATAASSGSITQTNICPQLPPMINANHHRRADATSPPTVTPAFAGNANPIDLITETSYIPLNTAGGTMLGELFCNATPTSIHTTGDITSAGSVAASGNVSATGSLNGGTSTLGSLTVQGNTILNNLAGTTAIHGIAQFFSTVLLPYDPSVALQAATKQYTDGYIGVGAYTGNGSTQQSISATFAPRVGIVFPTSAVNAESIWVLLTSTLLRMTVNTATGNIYVVGVAPSTAVLTLSGVGFLTGTSGPNSANVNGETYFWLAYR